MKKIIIISTIIVAILSVAIALGFRNKKDKPTAPINTTSMTATSKTSATVAVPTTTLSTEEWVEQNRVIPDVIPEFIPGSIKTWPAEEAWSEHEHPFSLSYRYVYYALPQFIMGLREDKVDEWTTAFPNGEPQEMVVVSFIKYFQIPKEEFENAVALQTQWEIKVGNDILQEEHEPFNVDIIYTFDNDIINEYYRRR